MVPLLLQAADTGHLVTAAMHAKSTFEALYRLREWGGDPALITTNVLGISLQVLIRKLCQHCKAPSPLSHAQQELLRRYGAEIEVSAGTAFYQAVGCEQCHGIGYAGRDVALEFFEFTPELRDAFLRGVPREELAQLAQAGGMGTLEAAGIRKAMEGITSLEEIMARVVR